MPQKLAGWRIEPPVSVPVASSAARAATAAAEPPDEPPRTSGRLSPRRRHGFSVGPRARRPAPRQGAPPAPAQRPRVAQRQQRQQIRVKKPARKTPQQKAKQPH